MILTDGHTVGLIDILQRAFYLHRKHQGSFCGGTLLWPLFLFVLEANDEVFYNLK